MNKQTVQVRLTVSLVLITTIIMTVLLFTVKAVMFTGVPASSITCEQEIGVVPYYVSDITERVVNLSESHYKIVLDCEIETAPSFEFETTTAPADLKLGQEYMVEWVHTYAVYDKFVRSKDNVALQYAGQTVSEESKEKAISEVRGLLQSQLRKVVSPAYKWFALLIRVVNVILCYILAKQAKVIADKWAKEDVWSVLQEQLNATLRESKSKTYYGMDTSVLKVDGLPNPTLPFRAFESDAEWEKWLASRKVVIDLNDMTQKDKPIMEADIKAVKATNKINRSGGVIADINVSGKKVATTEKQVSASAMLRPPSATSQSSSFSGVSGMNVRKRKRI